MILFWAALLTLPLLVMSKAVTNGVPLWGAVVTWLALGFAALIAEARARRDEAAPRF